MTIKNYIRLITIAIIAVISLESCNSTIHYKDSIERELLKIDKIIPNNTISAIERLDKIDSTKLSKKNRKYYNLLSTISDRIHYRSKIDNHNISKIYNYYKDLYIKDSTNSFIEYNYARAMLYYSISKYSNNVKDSLIHSQQSTAQNLLTKHVASNYYNAIACSYLATTCYHYKDLTKSEYYYKEAFKEYEYLGLTEELLSIKLDRSLNFFISRRYSLVKSSLEDMELNIDKATKMVKTGYDILLSAYLATRKEYAKAKEIANIWEKEDTDNFKGLDSSKLHFAKSRYYSHINEIDKALKSANKAINMVNTLSDTPDRIHNYYRNIGDIYSINGAYKEASIAYKNAFNSSINSIIDFHNNVQQNSINRYKESINISNREREDAESITLLLLLLISAISFIFTIIIILQRNRARKILIANKLNQLNTSKAISDITSLDVLPKFLDKMNIIASEKFSSVEELRSYIAEAINNGKAETRKKMLDLINNDAFITTHPLFNYRESFSDQEKIIIFLIKHKLTTRQISGLINVSQSSIRGSKVKIKQKIATLAMPDDQRELFLKDL